MSIDALVSRLEAAVAKLGGAAQSGETPVTVTEYDRFYSNSVQPFLDVVSKIDQKQATATETSFKHTRVVIECAAQCKKPGDADLMAVLGPIPGVIADAQKVNNRSAIFNFEKAFEEMIQCLNWLMSPNPKGAVIAQLEAADLYLNKILTAAKDKQDPEKTQWRDYVKLAKGMLTALGDYCNDFHKSGLTWKTTGGDTKSFKPGQKAGGGEKKDAGVNARLEAAVVALEALAAKKKGGDGGDAACVTEYALFYKESVQPFIDGSNLVDPSKRLAGLTEKAFKFLGVFIKATTVCKKPSPEELMAFIGPIAQAIQDAGARQPKSTTPNHDQAFSEGIQALNFICMDGNFKGYILGQIESGALYSNKILVAVKDKPDPEKSNNRKWVSDLKALLTNLAQFTQDHFASGILWKANGSALKDFKA